MKSIIFIVTILMFASNYIVAQQIYKVPIGSVDNEITIKVTNSTDKTIASVSVDLISSPEWISFVSKTSTIVDLGSVSSENVSFKFNLLETAPVNTEGNIQFMVTSSDGKIVQKLFKVNTIIPDKYEILQNYPNPFNPITTIKFSLPEDKVVSLKVFNILGETVKVLLNEEKKAGLHSVQFDASSLSSDVYFYSLEAGDYKSVKKMILIK